MNTSTIDYKRWRHLLTVTQQVLAALILLTEIASNFLLYITRSQGYGPDTIVQKLFRYLVLTTIINYGAIVICQIIISKSNNTTLHKYVLIMTTELICINVTYSHYQFSVAFAVFVVPLILSIFYEDKMLLTHAFGISFAGVTIGIIARGMDPVYGVDIGPEAAITYVLLAGVYIFSRICLKTLADNRIKLNEALVEAEKAKYVKQVEEMSFQTLNALANAIDAKDKYTNGHSSRVAEYSILLAKELDYSDEELSALKQEALLHDIGKIGIPDSVLNKPGKLTDVEFKVMQSHTTIGAQILKNMVQVPGAHAVANGHHERYDGKGYPNGLVGTANCEHARIVAICDAYDAMSSDRIYRKALSPEAIREQLINGRGTQFDPEFLDVFVGLIDSGTLAKKADSLNFSSEVSAISQNVQTDLATFLSVQNDVGEYNGAFGVPYRDFAKIYEYLKNISTRLKHSFETVMITITPIDEESVTADDVEAAARAMELAIRKNIRTVDIYTRYSETQHIAILLEAGADNVDNIVQRIFLDYYKFYDGTNFNISYETGK